MDELITALKVYLANAYQMYTKAHGFHWNIEGRDFDQYHGFFSGIYEEVYDSVDAIAENIRKTNLAEYAPYGLATLAGLSTIPETKISGTQLSAMLTDLDAANTEVMNSIRAAYKLAEAAGEIGLSNFLQDRYDAHAKHRWQIRASSK